jgi:hypothetical protein
MNLNSTWSTLEECFDSLGDYAYLLATTDSELSCDFYINRRWL